MRSARVSAVSTTSATQTSPKPVQRAADMRSPSSSTPHSSCSVGVRYCRSPTVLSGSRRAAAAKSSSGTTVATPVEASSNACHGGFR